MAIKPILLFCLKTGLMLLAIILLFFYLYQERLLFFPQPLAQSWTIDRSSNGAMEQVEFKTRDGVRLHGWFLQAETEKPAPLLIFFGGNAEEVSWLIGERFRLPKWNILLMNYRGYGLSEGRPSQAALFADAVQIHDIFTQRPEVDSRRVVALGRSLGTGVAVHLAKNRALAGVILISPFDSIRRLAQDLYRFLPVGLLLKHPFDSIALAPQIDTPVLIVAGDRDTLVVPQRSRRLYEAWAGPKQFRLIAGADHNTIMDDAECWRTIGNFLRPLEHKAS